MIINYKDIKTLDDFKNFIQDKTVAVVGLATSNIPLIAFLKKCGVKNITARDRKYVSVKDAELITGEAYLSNLTEDIIFKTPGMRRDIPELAAAEENGSILTSEMELFFMLCPADVYAVTGSSGKTTTTTIIGEILKEDGKTVHTGGNIGMPLLCDIEKIKKDDYVVLELSSFQLTDLQNSPPPKKAVITNISPNHLDWHTDMEEYKTAKSYIFKNQTETDTLILNYNDETTDEFIRKNIKSEIIYFSFDPIETDKKYTAIYNNYLCINDSQLKKVICKDDILLIGDYNIENYLAAIAAVYGEADTKSIINVAKRFNGVPHRREFIREYKGIKFYESSIDSSPSRTVATLNSFDDDKNIILILGGKNKNVPFTPLLPVMKTKVKTAVLYGDAADDLLDALSPDKIETDKDKYTVYKAKNFNDAVTSAYSFAKSGDIILLSPACTSFDMFKNFEERAEVFKQIVNDLK